jgi:ribosomal protein S18 acetylase RimI-like enzyme
VIEVRRIRAGEGSRLKALRLRALAESPDAFGTTLAEADRRPDDDWAGQAALGATSDTTAIVVAVDSEDWLGMARGVREPEQADAVEFVSLWVDPARRRSGIATALFEAVAQWARERGARRLQLWVTETNTPAKSLYVRLGFVETGEITPHPSNPALREVQLIRDL